MLYIEFCPTNQIVRGMQEFLIFGLACGAVVCLVLSAILLRYGVIIDNFPAGEEEKRDRSRWSPVEFTRISVIVFWMLFFPAGWMALQQSRVLMVGGIAMLVGLALFLFTAVIFSMSVLHQMGSKGSSDGASSTKGAKPGEKKSFLLFPALRLRKNGKKPRLRLSAQKK